MARSRTRLVLAVLGAAALPALVACNAIVGLSDFEKRECAGLDPCPFDGGPDVQNDRVVPDGGADAEAGDVPRGADPVSWPAFKMPNYRDGAAPLTEAPNPLSYDTTAGPDVVTDKVTGLVWRTKLQVTDTFDKALAACASLESPGAWRLPKRIELVTLLDYYRGAPTIDTSVFTGVSNVRVWTSSERRPFVPTAPVYWVVDFASGKVEWQEATPNIAAGALCVKNK
jgi:hypothetical protein